MSQKIMYSAISRTTAKNSMTAHCGRNPIFVHLKFLNNTNFDFKNRAKIEKDWFQIE